MAATSEAIRPRARALDRWDEALIEAIARSAAGRTFTAAAVFRHREFDDGLLRAFEDACIDNPRQLGRLLRVVERAGACGDLRVLRVRDGAAGLTWRCRRVGFAS